MRHVVGVGHVIRGRVLLRVLVDLRQARAERDAGLKRNGELNAKCITDLVCLQETQAAFFDRTKTAIYQQTLIKHMT